jgi:hypothetical protein
MDTNTLENTLDPNDSEATYRALRDSILQIYQFGTKIAKESNADNELQVSWELGDTSLINWISDTHCYLSRKDQKLQFLARPSKLEIISFSLDEGDKLLICSDSLRQNLSDSEIDEILRRSNSSESACQSLLKIATASNQENNQNIVVMEVINNQRVVTANAIEDSAKANKEKGSKKIWLLVPILLIGIAALAFLVLKKNGNGLNSLLGRKDSSVAFEDTVNFINKDSLALARANEALAQEFENEKQMAAPADDFAKTTPETPSTANSSTNNSFENTTEANKPVSKTEKSSNSSSFPAKRNQSSDFSTTTTSTTTKPFNAADEEQNYNALLDQQAKWQGIKNDLQELINSGNEAAKEKLKNSETVLERIEQKIRISKNKLGRN